MWMPLLTLLLAAAAQTSHQGACIGVQAGLPQCSFSVEIDDGPGAKQLTVHSQKSDGSDGKHARWKELASITMPIDPAHRVAVAAICEYKGNGDDTVVTLIPLDITGEPEMIPAVDWAYRIDLPSGRFIAIDPHDVQCANTSIGAD